MLSSHSKTTDTFPNSWGELNKSNFLFFKIFQNSLNFYNFIPIVQLEGCFIITSSYLKRKNKQKYEDLVHSKFKDIISYINFLIKIFSKTEILPKSQEGTGQRRIRYISLLSIDLISTLKKIKYRIYYYWKPLERYKIDKVKLKYLLVKLTNYYGQFCCLKIYGIFNSWLKDRNNLE